MNDQYEYVPHRLLRQRVRDIASGTEGVLMAVVNENVSDCLTYERWMELAYIRGKSGREFTTAVENVVPAYDQSEASRKQRDRSSPQRAGW